MQGWMTSLKVRHAGMGDIKEGESCEKVASLKRNHAGMGDVRKGVTSRKRSHAGR